MKQHEIKKIGGYKQLTSSSGRWLTGVVITLGLSLLTSLAFAKSGAHPYDRWAEEFGIDLNVSYDGVRIIEFQGGQFEATERRAPGKMYSEIQMSGMTSGVILREDLQKSYILIPSMGLYKEESLKGGMLQASNGLEFSKIEKIGREDINGHPSNKFKTRFKDNEGKGAGIMWITDTGVPIKVDMIYSSKKMKGQRISMEFIELNFREQDPAFFELPPNLKPMGLGGMGAIFNMKPASPGTDSTGSSPSAANVGDSSDSQQACIEEAVKAAEQKKSAQKSTKGIGRLLGKMARTANRLGLSNKLGGVSRDIYNANATATDVADIARDLGITEEDVERCREPS